MRGLYCCPDCGVQPGSIHKENCDVERCSVCGMQRLSCECGGHDKSFSRWVGVWPGVLEANHIGLDMNEFYIEGMHKIFFVKPIEQKL